MFTRSAAFWPAMVAVTLLAVVWLPFEALYAGIRYWLTEWKYVIHVWREELAR